MVAFTACEEEIASTEIDENVQSVTEGTDTSSEDSEEIVEEEMELNSADFTVTIENVVTPKPIFESGVFAVPMGKSEPAPLFPGDAYEFEINAGPHVLPGDGGTRLSFVTMFVQSNDLFLLLMKKV